MAASTGASPAELMRGAFEAVGSRDLDALLPYWDDETFGIVHPLDIALHGRDDLAAYFAEVFVAMPDLTLEIVAIHPVADDTAIGQWRLGATFTGGPLAGLSPSGRRVEVEGIEVMRFDGAIVRHNEVHGGGIAVARQVGLLPPADSTRDRAMRTAFNAASTVRRHLRS